MLGKETKTVCKMAPFKYLVCFISVIVSSSVQCKIIGFEAIAPSVTQMSRAEQQANAEDAVVPRSEVAGAPLALSRDGDTRTDQIEGKQMRCGVVDMPKPRVRRYAHRSFRWTKKHITYRVVNGARTLSKERVEAQVAKAFAMWAPHCDLTFSREDSDGARADIMISFHSGEHGDKNPFDGPYNILAHAFSPVDGEYAGLIHFDDDEMWTDTSDLQDTSVMGFFGVALHEIGHALGLDHSKLSNSIMFDSYNPEVKSLHEDDLLGMRNLYRIDGKPTETIKTMEASPAPQPRLPVDSEYPNLCNTQYDTLQIIHGKIYVFEKEWVWVFLAPNKPEQGSPRRLHDVFHGLPTDVTAVKAIYQKPSGNVVIFSGRNFWEFDSTFRFIKRSNISKYSIPWRVPELTTVFQSNNKTYLFNNVLALFWRYDEGRQMMDKGYPKYMSARTKYPRTFDAAFVWKGDTHFFKGSQTWRYNYRTMAAGKVLPVARTWLNCFAKTNS